MLRRSIVFTLLALILVTCITGCKGCKNRRNRRKQNEALYSKEKYSDLIIDSTIVEKEIARDTTLSSYQDDIIEFYQRRNYQSAWFSGGKLTVSAYDLYNKLQEYREEFGDTTMNAGLTDLEIGELLFKGTPQAKAILDARLTAAFFRYADREYSGSTADPKDLEWFIPRMKKDYQRLIDSLVSSPSTYAAYEPVNDYYKAIKKALVQYRSIEQHGGLPVVKTDHYPLQQGDTAEPVKILKSNLRLTGDYVNPDAGPAYTDTLAAAVRGYQRRLGLRATGKVDSITLAEINEPVSLRIRQIMLNMERLRWMPDSTPSNYILVNIPEYRLHVYEDYKVAWSMDVVVGNAATATNIFTGKLSVVDFCPYWNVPQSIIKNEMLPKLKRDGDYLDKNNLEVVRDGEVINGNRINWNKYTNSVPFVIRQKPGSNNSLGLVAFFFPNSYDIFLHDTPAKSFFGENDRAFSHGCIRLAEPERLADYLFRNDSIRMPKEKIREMMDSHIEKKVAVKPSIPVYITYFTAWVDQHGRINFRHDIYGHDAKLAKEIFGK